MRTPIPQISESVDWTSFDTYFQFFFKTSAMIYILKLLHGAVYQNSQYFAQISLYLLTYLPFIEIIVFWACYNIWHFFYWGQLYFEHGPHPYTMILSAISVSILQNFPPVLIASGKKYEGMEKLRDPDNRE
ncbi:hypothetical protein FGO68_gene10326 [Halteria grandinella]|uniref:Uncharacterized protein n=1 Tax=Halteria grandinella TaxID=5974 RepID=A0A8J8NLZ0_HALGN|nr:hypothetical protein FGO68_gene10326 [Halteria grandinella]